MDPITHTLTGGALAGAGLRRVSPGATATLILASNAPDVDALAYMVDPHWALAVRRGLTHGVLGLLLLPPLVVGIVLLWKRWRRRRRGMTAQDGGGGGGSPPAPRLVPLLGLAFLAVLIHQLLDWTNNYGMRFWEPFSSSWSYLDALFIVDPWIWLLLGGGLLLAWRWGERWVRLGGVAALAYVLFMVASGALARAEVRSAWEARELEPSLEVMAAPVPLNPLARSVVVETRGAYHMGSFHWLERPRVHFQEEYVPKMKVRAGFSLSLQEAMEGAREDPRMQDFLVWSRFPHYEVGPLPEGGAEVVVGDARFTGWREAGRLSGLRVEVGVPPPPSGGDRTP